MKRPILVNLSVLLVSFLLCAFLLEVLSRLLFEAPPSVVIENLSDPAAAVSVLTEREGVTLKDGQIFTKGVPDSGFYIHTPTGRRLRPGVSGAITRHHLTKRDVAFSTNSYGYRDDEIGEKTDRDYRILVLGDSITLGDYADVDQTYPVFIGRSLLASEHAALEDRDVRVINAGVGSINLQTELAILMETGLLIEPDVVLVGLYLNDAYQSPMLKIRRLSSTLSWSHFLRVASMWLDVTRDRFIYEGTGMKDKAVVEVARQDFISTHAVAEGDWRTSREAFHSMIAAKIHDWGYAWTDDFWEKIIPILELMKEVGDEHGFRVAVMLLPVSYQVKSDLLMDEPQQEFDRQMKALGIAHLDLLPPMREKYQRDGENIFHDHCHYRPEGNEYLAEIASEFLLREVIGR